MSACYTTGEKLKKGGVKKKKRRVKYAQVLSVNVRAEYLLLMVVLLTACLDKCSYMLCSNAMPNLTGNYDVITYI